MGVLGLIENAPVQVLPPQVRDGVDGQVGGLGHEQQVDAGLGVAVVDLPW